MNLTGLPPVTASTFFPSGVLVSGIQSLLPRSPRQRPFLPGTGDNVPNRFPSGTRQPGHFFASAISFALALARLARNAAVSSRFKANLAARAALVAAMAAVMLLRSWFIFLINRAPLAVFPNASPAYGMTDISDNPAPIKSPLYRLIPPLAKSAKGGRFYSPDSIKTSL